MRSDIDLLIEARSEAERNTIERRGGRGRGGGGRGIGGEGADAILSAIPEDVLLWKTISSVFYITTGRCHNACHAGSVQMSNVSKVA